ncbi:MAG: hypothetical protein ACK4ZN_01475 [Oceanibaculum sp.]
MRSPTWGKQSLKPLDLINTARDLIRTKPGKPSQANLKRAVSTAYYAVFHCLARTCADLLIGSAGAARNAGAWQHVYRALEHGTAKNACVNQAVIGRFPIAVQNFAAVFVALQEKRHSADYDPAAQYYKSAVRQDIDDAHAAITAFEAAPAQDKRAFAALVLFKGRR